LAESRLGRVRPAMAVQTRRAEADGLRRHRGGGSGAENRAVDARGASSSANHGIEPQTSEFLSFKHNRSPQQQHNRRHGRRQHRADAPWSRCATSVILVPVIVVGRRLGCRLSAHPWGRAWRVAGKRKGNWGGEKHIGETRRRSDGHRNGTTPNTQALTLHREAP
jgi:hypothetical protein